MTVILPEKFDGKKFADKYNLDPFVDFRGDGNGNLICPSLPNLLASDLLDCVVDTTAQLSPPQQIILADGADVAKVTISGEPNALVDYDVNGSPFQATLDTSGQDVIEITSDTPNTTIVVQSGTARAVIYAVEVTS